MAPTHRPTCIWIQKVARFQHMKPISCHLQTLNKYNEMSKQRLCINPKVVIFPETVKGVCIGEQIILSCASLSITAAFNLMCSRWCCGVCRIVFGLGRQELRYRNGDTINKQRNFNRQYASTEYDRFHSLLGQNGSASVACSRSAQYKFSNQNWTSRWLCQWQAKTVLTTQGTAV